MVLLSNFLCACYAIGFKLAFYLIVSYHLPNPLHCSLADSLAVTASLRAEVKMYENNIKELQHLNQMLRDEHQALQLAFASLEEKLRKTQVKTHPYIIIYFPSVHKLFQLM